MKMSEKKKTVQVILNEPSLFLLGVQNKIVEEPLVSLYRRTLLTAPGEGGAEGEGEEGRAAGGAGGNLSHPAWSRLS